MLEVNENGNLLAYYCIKFKFIILISVTKTSCTLDYQFLLLCEQLMSDP